MVVRMMRRLREEMVSFNSLRQTLSTLMYQLQRILRSFLYFCRGELNESSLREAGRRISRQEVMIWVRELELI